MKNMLLMLVTFLLIFIVMGIWENYQTRQGFLLRPPTNEQVMQWAKDHNVTPDNPEYSKQFLLQAKVYTFFELMWKPLVVVLLLNVLVLLTANIYYSNRIVGPIHRLKKVLKKKIEGQQIYPVSFREGDPFQELAELTNQVLFRKEELDDFNKKNGVKSE
jgi:hypothetical protein